MITVGVVFGTYNRLELLKLAVASVRAAAPPTKVTMFIVDGGSTDGTREWLKAQVDVIPLFQEGPLTGAVAAFNLGFSAAVEMGCRYVFHLNDDAEILTPHSFAQAIALMETHPDIGEVAFEFDLRGPMAFEYVNGKLYGNFGMIRTVAGKAVARAQGDPTGRKWWNPIYRTYGADCEFGMWLWKLGWKVHPGIGLQVHDAECKDELRKKNEATNPDREDSKIFWSRVKMLTGSA